MSTSPWDCLSCGARAQVKAFCEQCGAAQAIDGEDSALSMMLGLVCEGCDAYNDPGKSACISCGVALGGSSASTPSPPTASPLAPQPEPHSWMSAPTGRPLPEHTLPKDERAASARRTEGTAPSPARLSPPSADTTLGPHHAPGPMCSQCNAAHQPDDKFCRNCGASLAKAAITELPRAATILMPASQRSTTQAGLHASIQRGSTFPEGSAKLLLVRGHSPLATQWRLHLQQTVIGRSEGTVQFPDDPTLAALHCRLSFRESALNAEVTELWLEPEPTLNGVFLRVREPMRLQAGDEIVIGAQRLRILSDGERPLVVSADAVTRVLGSHVRASQPITLLHVSGEPSHNQVFYRCQRVLTIGRSHCDLTFPHDSFVSERHAQITHESGGLVLEDLRSRNGTYVRVQLPTRLLHGDLILLGDNALRVELSR